MDESRRSVWPAVARPGAETTLDRARGALAALRNALPEGQSLPDEVWRRRHRALLLFVWLHAAAIGLYGTFRGAGLLDSMLEANLIASFGFLALVASRRSRKLQETLVAAGLLTSSAVLVNLSGGVIEAHFHYFVIMAMLMLYEDWFPYLFALAYVVGQHGLVGLVHAHSVYDHENAVSHPWRWALVHGAFIGAAGVANVVHWRLNEDVRAGLQRSEERYRDLFDNDTDMVFRVDLTGRITDVNPAGEQLTGYGRDELLGLDSDTLVPETVRARVQAELGRKLSGEVDETMYEAEFLMKDGGVVPVDVVTRVLRVDGEVVGVQGNARDARQRRALEEQLRQSQKMDAVGQLAGGIAHDFNNLLLAITGYSEIARSRLEAGETDVTGELGEVLKAADRAASLTEQLLAFGRRQMLQPKVLDVNTIAVDMESLLRRLIGENVELETNLAPDLAAVKADPSQIEQVIVNLALNARDAMPGGGRLTIETANVELDETCTIQHGQVVVPGRYAMLSVRDTGHGIDAATMERLFEPFFTTKDKGKGTGLGLATVWGVVNQSGGYVAVSSEPGHGTTFTVYLPCVADAAPAVESPAARAEAPHGSETVLLVEDEPVVRQLAENVLAAKGYNVLTAVDGVDAIEFCDRHAGSIDLLVTDVVMPRMGGRELADTLTPRRPELKVLFMSGYADDAILHHGILEEHVAFIQKPFAVDAFAHKVRDVLDRSAA